MSASTFCDDGVARVPHAGAPLSAYSQPLDEPSSQRRPALPRSFHGFKAGRDFDLGELWVDIIEGRWFVLATTLTDDHCSTVLRRGPRNPLGPRSAAVLRQALLGEAQKNMAYDLGVGASTLSGVCHQALTTICSESRVSRAPLLLAMAAQAASGQRLPAARLEAGRADDLELTLNTPSPGACWRAVLSECEWHVARLALNGCTQREIAATRGTSGRTIANQMSSIFQKLHVSGRCALRAAAVLTLAANASSSANRMLE